MPITIRVVHNLILSNVPGPPVPLYLAGLRVVGLYPFGPITDGAALNVTVLSQDGRVGFGIITCPDLIPRVWDLARAIPGALGELVETVGSPRRTGPPGHPSAGRLGAGASAPSILRLAPGNQLRTRSPFGDHVPGEPATVGERSVPSRALCGALRGARLRDHQPS